MQCSQQGGKRSRDDANIVGRRASVKFYQTASSTRIAHTLVRKKMPPRQDKLDEAAGGSPNSFGSHAIRYRLEAPQPLLSRERSGMAAGADSTTIAECETCGKPSVGRAVSVATAGAMPATGGCGAASMNFAATTFCAASPPAAVLVSDALCIGISR